MSSTPVLEKLLASVDEEEDYENIVELEDETDD